MKMSLSTLLIMFTEQIGQEPAYDSIKKKFIVHMLNKHTNLSQEFDSAEEFNKFTISVPEHSYKVRLITALTGFEEGEITLEDLKWTCNYYAKCVPGLKKVVEDTFMAHYHGHYEVLNPRTSPILLAF